MNMSERKARLTQLRRAVYALAKKAGKGGLTSQEQSQLVAMDRESERLESIIKGEYDVAHFAYQYFSDERNPNNEAGNIIRHYSEHQPHESIDEMAAIHRDFYDICDEITKRKNNRFVIASPRGHAKSSVISTIKALHSLCYNTNGQGDYILIISETDTLAKRLVASIANQLKYNERLREDFGELLYKQSNKNERDNEDTFITTKKQLVEASSAGKSLRGKTFNGIRPTLLLADDISSLNNEATEEQRQKLIHWWNSVVEPLPSADGVIVFVGTKITASGLLSNLLDRREYRKLFHAAVINEPDNPHLWSDYLHMYTGEATDDELDEFYEKNRDELESGIELAWSNRWTYRELMHVKASIGSRAFASEYMNQSFASDEQHFSPEEYAYGRRVFDGQYHLDAIEYNDKYYYLRDMDKVSCWDPALAGNNRSALNAYVTLGRHRESGLVFVIDVYASRQVPSVFIMEILPRMVEYKPDKCVVEGIGAYRAYAEQLADSMRHNSIYHTRLSTIKTHGTKSKASRIESLEVPLANHSLILNRDHKEVYRELQDYPNAVTVDLLDAIEMAFSSAKKREARIIPKPDWMYGPITPTTTRDRTGRMIGRGF
ncbi:hypothetical protein JTI58_03445 [Lysinibacillus fusiformis]|uniref:hypothetical protein n=1 Tax=Lysinibacillus fusiformis TaxID=28031 RepID=UPI00196877B6|nr:hypothetical protein [Lysinibacillus fusiformis]QSB10747.1 hypothetical protein JTI58_03445 [Lysinibacillus fusiformis]